MLQQQKIAATYSDTIKENGSNKASHAGEDETLL